MKLETKWPIAKQPIAKSSSSHQQALFIRNTPEKEKISNTVEATGVGITTMCIFIIGFITLYATTWRSGGIKFDFSLFKKGITEIPGFTMSEVFEQCNKVIATVFLVIFFAFLQSLYSIQNFNLDDPYTCGTIVVNYILLGGLFLLYFVPPKQGGWHSAIAILISVCILLNTVLTTVAYNQFYSAESLQILNIPAYIIVALFGLIVILFISYYFIQQRYTTTTITSTIIALSEICCLISFAVFIGIFSQLPPIPNKNSLVCVINPNI